MVNFRADRHFDTLYRRPVNHGNLTIKYKMVPFGLGP